MASDRPALGPCFGTPISPWLEPHLRRCARSQTPNAITTAPASANQVMAYCR